MTKEHLYAEFITDEIDDIEYIGIKDIDNKRAEIEKEIINGANKFGIKLNDSVSSYCASSKKEFVLHYIFNDFDCNSMDDFIDYFDYNRWLEDNAEELKIYVTDKYIIGYDIWNTNV